MPSKKKKIVEQYDFLAIRVETFSAGVDASINYEARDSRNLHDDIRVYKFDSSLEIEGICTYPDDRVNDSYRITIYGRQQGHGDLDATLADYHVRDKDGSLKFRTVRRTHKAVYKIPNGLGLIEKERGTKNWRGWIWVPEQTATQMLTLVTTTRPLYIHIHERRIERTRWINGLTLQTTDPAEE